MSPASAGRHRAVLYHGMPRPLFLTVLTAALTVLVGPAPHAAPRHPVRRLTRRVRGSSSTRTTATRTAASGRIGSTGRSRPACRWRSSRTWSGSAIRGAACRAASCRTASRSPGPSRRWRRTSSSASGRWSRRRSVSGRRETWPLIILNLDLKTNEPEHHAAIWETLGTYEAWLTTAARVADGTRPAPLDVKPVLVLTEQPRRAAGGLSRSRPRRRPPAPVRRDPGRRRSQGGEGQGGDPEAGRAQPGRADRERRDQLSPLGELPVGGGRAWRPGRGRRLDAGRRSAPRGDRRAGAQPRPVDPLLHAQRPRGGRRPRLDGQLQLRLARGRRVALARGARRRRRLHRHRPVRGAGPGPGPSGRPVGDATRDLTGPRIAQRPGVQGAASRCCRTAGASARPAGTCRPATSRWR